MWIKTKISNDTGECMINLDHFRKIKQDPDNGNLTRLYWDETNYVTIESHFNDLSEMV